MDNIKGYIYAAASSSTFGLAPFSPYPCYPQVFFFRSISLSVGSRIIYTNHIRHLLGETFCINRKDFGTVFILSLFRAATSLSLVIAYQHIASGVASTIHFMYPLAVALAMMFFFREKSHSQFYLL